MIKILSKNRDLKNTILKFINLRNLLIICLLSFFIFATLLSYKRYLNFGDAIFDYGLQEQIVFNISNGNLFSSSVEGINYLGDHFSPILILPAIIYKFIPGPLTIFAIQSGCITISALGIFLLADKILKKRYISFLLTILFCFYTPISVLLIWDFHEIVLALPFLIWGIYFYHVKKFRLTLLFFIIASFAKEDVGIFIGGFGLYLFLIKKDIKGIILLLYGYVYSLLSLFIFIPAFRHVQAHTLERYSDWGTNGLEIVKGIITNPLKVITYSFSRNKISYILRLFLPVGFLPIFAPFAIIIFLPSLFINLLSSSLPQVSGLAQYDVLNTVGLFYCSIVGISNFKLINKVSYEKTIKLFVILILLPLSIIFIFLTNPIWKVLIEVPTRYDDYLYLQNIKKKIPDTAVLATSNMVGSLFANRTELQLFYPEWEIYNTKPDIIIVDKKKDFVQKEIDKINLYKKELGYIEISNYNSFIILERSNYIKLKL